MSADNRKYHNTIDHIFALHTLIDLYLNKKKRLYCALSDYKKAFDCVDRTLLWQRILESNVNGKLFRVIYNMYDAAKSCIKVGNNLSEVFHCNIGVRQGENLSPILFAMLINEFKNNLSTQYNGVHLNQLYNTDIELQLKLFTLLYADDTIVLAETERELQSALDAVHEYCNNMHLTVNTQKTKVMIFSRGKVRKYQNFMFGGSILDVTYEYVYLGVNFNNNTSFIKAIERHRVVLPVVLYASEIYGHSDSCIKKLEIFQRSLYKNTLKLSKSTPSVMIYGETGTTPLHITIEKRMIGYWLQIIMGSSSKLNYQIYKYVLHLDMQNIYSTQWIRKIKEILQRCGLFHIWVNQHSIRIEDSKTIRLLICTRINDQYEQTWHSSIPTHIRCSYYVLFKYNRKLEPYLYKLSTSNRIYLSKFRCRSNYMPVSKVYKHADTYDTKCKICDKNEIGDEFHYLFICPVFQEDRNRLLKEYYRKFPSMYKFIELMSTTNMKDLRKLAQFATIIIQKFQ